MLRAPEGQGPDRGHPVPAAFHRRHVRDHRQVVRRQDSNHHRRLRPRRFGRRHGVRLELPARRHLLGRRGHAGAARRQEGRRPRQAQGQEDRAGLSRFALRQGADRSAAGARQDARLRAAAAAGDASGRRAEGDLAADPPATPGLRVPVGLGRDELDRDQGSGRHRLSAREDVRRLVVGRRARCHACGRRRQGLQRARVPGAVRPGAGTQGHPQVCLRQGPGHRQEGGDRRGALQPRHGVGDDGRRRREARPDQVRQEAAQGRGSALGPGEPGNRQRFDQETRFRRLHASGKHLLRRPRRRPLGIHPYLGRQEVGRRQGALRGRHADHQAADPRFGGEVRGGERRSCGATARRSSNPSLTPLRERGPGRLLRRPHGFSATAQKPTQTHFSPGESARWASRCLPSTA